MRETVRRFSSRLGLRYPAGMRLVSFDLDDTVRRA
jgi:hypothetical protein